MLETAQEKLGGTVEIDETYVGGKARRWRPSSDKFLFRDTILKLIGSPTLEYKDRTAKIQDAV
jgi:hypothetical protein